MRLGIKALVDFQNVDTDGHDSFAALGGDTVPALWDGVRLHEGRQAVMNRLTGLRAP